MQSYQAVALLSYDDDVLKTLIEACVDPEEKSIQVALAPVTGFGLTLLVSDKHEAVSYWPNE